MPSKRPSVRIVESAPPPLAHELAVSTLSRARETGFDLTPDAAERRAIAESLGLLDLKRMRFRGALTPAGREGWRLTARLTAEVEQACVATLRPVGQKIDITVERAFEPVEDAEEAVAIDLDPAAEDAPDPFVDRIDVAHVAIEELALALEPYPRAEGVEAVELKATPPGAAPLDDEALKPFAGLAALRDKLKGE